jgi:adenosylcobinamide-GDP ribazoletransferase
MSAFGAGIRLAVTTLTVLPAAPADRAPDRADARVAMSVAPAVGGLIGLIAGAVGLSLIALGTTALVAAAVAVSVGVLLTRGLHLDGLADTVDGLGSYGGRERALEIMRKPDVGPFGVVALVLALLVQVAAASVVLTRDWPVALAGIVVAFATGRAAIALGCRRGVPAARPEGLGALVAGTVGRGALVAAAVVTAAVAMIAVPSKPWLGPLAVALGLATAWGLRRHAVRRLGGVTGDVLGAMCEVSATVTYVVLSM